MAGIHPAEVCRIKTEAPTDRSCIFLQSTQVLTARQRYLSDPSEVRVIPIISLVGGPEWKVGFDMEAVSELLNQVEATFNMVGSTTNELLALLR